MNGTLFFVAASSMDAYGDPCDPVANAGSCRLLGQELWKTDGTADGTALVKDISELGSSEPWNLTLSGGLLYFTADDGVAGRELWRSDGTGVGTFMVADVCSLDPSSEEINRCGVAPSVAGWGLDPSSSNPGGLTDVDGRLYFAAYDKEHGRELFRVSEAGDAVELVDDLYPGVSEQSGTWLCPYGSCLLPNSGLDAAGPTGSFSTLDGELFLSADDGQHGFEPWVFRSLTPAERIAQIVATVDGLVDAGKLKLGQGKSLIGKLELALYMLEYGNTKKAITMLEAFVQEVEAFQRGGVLDGHLAQDLIDAAQAAIASLAG
jgi:ELWxxDGT repeat protein